MDELEIGSDAFVTVMSFVNSKMSERQRSSSFLTGGRMVTRIESWLARKLAAGVAPPSLSDLPPHLLPRHVDVLVPAFADHETTLSPRLFPAKSPTHAPGHSTATLERIPVVRTRESCDMV